VTEYWLTRREALLIATQSDTPKAWEMTETIVDVFEAVILRGAALPMTAETVKSIVAETMGPMLLTMETLSKSVALQIETSRASYNTSISAAVMVLQDRIESIRADIKKAKVERPRAEPPPPPNKTESRLGLL